MAATQTTSCESLFNNSLFSDITIRQTCNGVTKEYHGHKAILAMHSQFFMKAFSGNFKEATEPVIELHDDDLYHFEIMLRYIYNRKWEEPTSSFGSEATNLELRALTSIGVYGLADKYDVLNLKERAVQQFSGQSNSRKYNALEWSQMVNTYYAQCIQPETLMGHAITSRLLRECGTIHQVSKFKNDIRKYPVFAADLLLL